MLRWDHPAVPSSHLLLLLLLHVCLLRLQLRKILEPRVPQRFSRADTHFRSQLKHPVKEVQAELVDLRENEP